MTEGVNELASGLLGAIASSSGSDAETEIEKVEALRMTALGQPAEAHVAVPMKHSEGTA